ncbi:MAG: RyR domain-containing protein [Actinocrinis sp.]
MPSARGGAVAQSLRESLPTRLVLAVRLALVVVAFGSMILGYFGMGPLIRWQLAQNAAAQSPVSTNAESPNTESPNGASPKASIPSSVLPFRPTESDSGPNLVYYDLELFLGQSQPVAQATWLPWQLQIARFAAPSVALYAIAEGSVALFASRFRRSRLRRQRGHAVVCGSTRTAQTVAVRLREHGMRVVVVADDVIGWPARDTSVADPRTAAGLETAGVANAHRLYACMDHSEENAQIASAAERIRAAAGRPERIHVLISDLELCTALRARRLSLAESTGRHLGFFNPDELAAHATVRTDAGATESGLDGAAPQLAIVGSGAFARSVLVEAARQWLARGGAGRQPLEVTLIDANADRVAARLLERYAFLEHSCLIHPDTEPFEAVLKRRGAAPELGPLRRLYLCQENESEALKAALDTAVRFQSAFLEVVVRLDRLVGMAAGFAPRPAATDQNCAGPGAGAAATGPESLGCSVAPTSSSASDGPEDQVIDVSGLGWHVAGGAVFDALGGRLRLVDVTGLGCDPEVIDEDLAEWLARACHLHYLSGSLDAGAEPGSSPALVPWEDLRHDYREANRSQVSDIGNKLVAIGSVLSPRQADTPGFAFRGGEIERLAVLEHGRWLAERRTRGWTLGRTRDEAAKKHPAMVGWDALPEDERDKDRDAVRQLPAMLADAGLSIIRVEPRPAR